MIEFSAFLWFSNKSIFFFSFFHENYGFIIPEYMDDTSNFQDRHVKIPDLTKAAKVLKNPFFAVEKELCSLKWMGWMTLPCNALDHFTFRSPAWTLDRTCRFGRP